MKTLFSHWAKRIITPIGKITVIKTLALSKINHLILSLPNPPPETIKLIQNIFYRFLWNNGPDKIKRTVITQGYECGGLRMINLEVFILSLKITWIRRLLLLNTKYFKFITTLYPFLLDFGKHGNEFIRTRTQNITNPFWKNVFEGLSNVNSQQPER